jgi:malate dehydrogenase
VSLAGYIGLSFDLSSPMKSPIKIAVTGAAGQIGYSLLPRIASGGLFGPEQPVELQLIEIPPSLKALEGVVMELHDCAFPLLHSVMATSDLAEGFQGVNWALLVGGVPRKAGMERKDLLGINGRIFVEQGRAIAKHAASDIRVLVVGNPCNTNCLIAMNNGREVPSDRWFAMTRLDENRAKTQLALKSGSHWRDVSNVAIWGNHSSTLYPDFFNARIGGKPVIDVISDREWLETTFIKTVQQRGASIIQARGLSSAKSAAHGRVGIPQVHNPSDSRRGLAERGALFRWELWGGERFALFVSNPVGRFQNRHRPRRIS